MINKIKPGIEIQIFNYYSDVLGINLYRNVIKDESPDGTRYKIMEEEKELDITVTVDFAIYLCDEIYSQGRKGVHPYYYR